MLATAGNLQQVRGPDWEFEVKWDGFRVQALVTPERTRLASRNGNDLSKTFPELLTPLRDATQAMTAVFDGEVVAIGPAGVPDFSLLQTRSGLTRPSDIKRAVDRTPVTYMVFDVIKFDDRDVAVETYTARRIVLENLLEANPRIQPAPVLSGTADSAVAASKQLHLEGIIAKRRDSSYQVGRRSRDWIKIKNIRTQEVVIAGWEAGAGALSGLVGSLILAIPDGDRLRFVGKVGTGFRDRDRKAMLERFADMTAPAPTLTGYSSTVHVHWIRPILVGEVQFLEWTPAGSMRHTTWRGWRPDKAATEVVLEDDGG